MEQAKGNNQMAQARREELVIQELPDEVLVYDLRQHKAHMLNQTAAFVWNHCDGHTTVAEMAELMEKEWHKPVGEDVVWLALKQLSKANLLQGPVAMPEQGTRVSRRQAMRKMGIAAMVPLVVSIVAPTALAAAASVPPECACCTRFGSGANRTNTCPPVCVDIPGCCFNNASCSTGVGGLLNGAVGCQDCFNNFPTSSGWRAVGSGCGTTVPTCA